MGTEIKPCPMPGCGGECVAQEAEASDVDRAFVTCMTCGYQGSNEERCEEAIIAHNALCADVKLARNLRKAAEFGIHIAHKVGGNRERWLLSTRSGTDVGSTLDAALAELTAKIGGSDER